MTMADYSILISIFALLSTFTFAWYNKGYSKIAILHSIQKLVLEKSKDCNELWKEGKQKYFAASSSRIFFNQKAIIDEIIISIDLIENSLVEFNQPSKRDFFLRQFWIQCNSEIKDFFGQRISLTPFDEITRQKISRIQKIFNPLFGILIKRP
jgi:hypothetical protein